MEAEQCVEALAERREEGGAGLGEPAADHDGLGREDRDEPGELLGQRRRARRPTRATASGSPASAAREHLAGAGDGGRRMPPV